MKGYIFNIQKFCLHDGPGIRTTVFFKGCDLRCKWCSNPESQKMDRQLTFDQEKCSACGKCAEICVRGARKIVDSKCIVNEDICSLCGACVPVCPAEAIKIEGEYVSVEDVMPTIMKDKVYYDHTGGGVTFSGGEPLMQVDFALELAHAIRNEGISLAIETTGAVSSDRFKAFLPLLDFVYMDFKHYDTARHREGTGIGNEQILENIRILRDSGIEFMLRIPVIPGFNDSLEDARRFAAYLKEMDIHRVQLLPFHQFGERKYALIKMKYAFSAIKQLHREDLNNYRAEFIRMGVEAEF